MPTSRGLQMVALLDSVSPATALGAIIVFVIGAVAWCLTVTSWLYEIRRTTRSTRAAFLLHRHIEVDGKEVVWWPPPSNPGDDGELPMPRVPGL